MSESQIQEKASIKETGCFRSTHSEPCIRPALKIISGRVMNTGLYESWGSHTLQWGFQQSCKILTRYLYVLLIQEDDKTLRNVFIKRTNFSVKYRNRKTCDSCEHLEDSSSLINLFASISFLYLLSLSRSDDAVGAERLYFDICMYWWADCKKIRAVWLSTSIVTFQQDRGLDRSDLHVSSVHKIDFSRNCPSV